MHDRDVRTALHARLGRVSVSLVVDELGLDYRSFVDVAAIGRLFHAYEIKSASDTLKRLPHQVEEYSKVFDRCTLVAADNHVVEAMGIIPDWWGVVEAKEVGGSTMLFDIRPAAPNPHVEMRALAMLLWRGDLLDLLKAHPVEPPAPDPALFPVPCPPTSHGLDHGMRGKVKKTIVDLVAESIPFDEIHAKVGEALSSRHR